MSKKISQLPAGTTLTGAEQIEMVQSATSKSTTAQEVVASTFAVTASGTDTYTATLSPALTAYTTNHKYYVLFTNANTGAATLNLNGLGAKSITKSGTTALSAGDIAAGQILALVYDGTRFQIVGGGSGGSGITGLTAGRIPYAASSTSLSDSSILLWDNSTGRMSVGTNSSNARLHVRGANNAVAFVAEDDSGNKILEVGESAGSRALGFFGLYVNQQTTGISGATYAAVGGTNIQTNDTFNGYTIAKVVAALQNYGLLA